MSEFARNKRAYFDYEILEKYEAGIELHGFEVKAIRAGRMSLAAAHVVVRGGEAWLLNADIQPYQRANTPDGYEISRTRRLLLHKNELEYLMGKASEKGLTIVPLRCYSRGRTVKIEIGVAKSRKQYDKREVLKKRAAIRDMRHAD